MGQSMMLMTRVLRATTEASIGGASSGGTTKVKEAKKKANKSKAAPLGACVRGPAPHPRSTINGNQKIGMSCGVSTCANKHGDGYEIWSTGVVHIHTPVAALLRLHATSRLGALPNHEKRRAEIPHSPWAQGGFGKVSQIRLYGRVSASRRYQHSRRVGTSTRDGTRERPHIRLVPHRSPGRCAKRAKTRASHRGCAFSYISKEQTKVFSSEAVFPKASAADKFLTRVIITVEAGSEMSGRVCGASGGGRGVPRAHAKRRVAPS